MTIEKFSPHNLKDLVVLVQALWPGCNFEEEYNYYKSLMDAGREICFLAKQQDVFIGFIHLSVRNDYVEGADELPVAYIEGIYVQPDHQNKGIAKKLLSAAEDWAKQHGLQQMASDTALTNVEAIAFHQKTGFETAGKIVCFIKKL